MSFQSRIAWLLPVMVSQAAAGANHGLGPALPGDARYWVKLKRMTFTDGKLEPEFDPDGTDFTLTVHNPKVRSLTVNFNFNSEKYDPMHMPKLEVDGKEIPVDPLNIMDTEVRMNDTVGEMDKYVVVRVSDPQGGHGGLLGTPVGGAQAKAHEYRIRILQAPEYDQVVLADTIKVEWPNGTVLAEVHGGDQNHFEFEIPIHLREPVLQATCNKYATDILINGRPVKEGEKVTVTLDAPQKTTLLECAYANELWTKSAITRTYQIHLKHDLEASPLPIFRSLPHSGACNKEMFDEDGELDENGKVEGYVCRSAHEEGWFVGEYDTGMGDMFVVDRSGSAGEVYVQDGLPAKVQISSPKAKYAIRMQGGSSVEFPLLMYVAQNCNNMKCPDGWVEHASLKQGMAARLHLCSTNKCDIKHDAERCCRPGGTPCEDFKQKFTCPAGEKFFEFGFCKGFPCNQEDVEYCCSGKHMGAFAPKKGTDEMQDAEKEDARVTKEEKKIAPRLSELITVKVDAPQHFAKDINAKVSITAAISKEVGCVPEDVSVQMQPASETSVLVQVSAVTLDGPMRTAALRKRLEALVKKEVTDAISAEMKKLKQDDQHEKVIKFGKVDESLSNQPFIEAVIEVEAPASDYLAEPSKQGSKSEEVRAMLSKDIAKTLKIPEKYVTLKLIAGSGQPVPGGRERTKGALKLTFSASDAGVGYFQISDVEVHPFNLVKLNEMLQETLTRHNEAAGKYKVANFKLVKEHGPEVETTPLPMMMIVTTSTSTPKPAVLLSQIKTFGDLCLSATERQEEAAQVVAVPCEDTSKSQQWVYNHKTGFIQNAFGICLAASTRPNHHFLNLDDSPELLAGYIEDHGSLEAHMWKCLEVYQQAWSYSETTGQMKIMSSQDPGLCLQVQANGDMADANTDLVVAFCDEAALNQQFWFHQVPFDLFLPVGGTVPMEDVPQAIVKPYYDGLATTIDPHTGAYDTQLAPFAKKRAAFYLTQGCSPVPTHSCGLPVPDMPNVYVGQSMLKVGENVSGLPWESAIMGSDRDSSRGDGACVYDSACQTIEKDGFGDSELEELEKWSSGCGAGGKPLCRYCGFGNFGDCPKYYDCADGGLPKGLWSQEKSDWCCKHFSVGCEAPNDCLEGIQNWKKAWLPAKKAWCCTYQNVGCENECKKEDPTTWRENHLAWCSIFDWETAQHTSSMEEMTMIMKDAQRTSIISEDSRLPTAMAVVSASALLAAGAISAWRSSHRLLPSSQADAAQRSLVHHQPSETELQAEALIA
eukprot:TRINITY_DN2684_c0_g1_i2.p1 TRINITY_DN2684_c0_g1~~TRINITY_DN2684_c0_g1_i2.p1  ORF type:complete len:1269 (-),score=309.15 TRINITY_DN2684_c0_g1_i2:165-3971(-)